MTNVAATDTAKRDQCKSMDQCSRTVTVGTALKVMPANVLIIKYPICRQR